MASRIEAPPFVIPAGTAIATPASMLLFDKRGTVLEIEFLIPPGPSGLVGFSVWHSSEQIIPWARGQWIVTNDEVIRWPLDGYSDQPDWRIRGYNLDIYPHTIYPRVLIEDWKAGTPMTPGPIEAVGA